MPANTLVLIPGLLNDSALWAYQIEQLSDLVDRVVVPDISRYDDIALIAAQVLTETEGDLAVAGLSMGGYVAFEILRQAPERVERLALIGTSARRDSDEQRRRRRGLIELAEKGRFKGVTPRLLPMLVHESRLQDETVTGPIFEMAARIGKDGFIRQQKAILGRPDSRDLLPTVAVPALVMVGRQDQLTPPHLAEEMTAGIAGASLHMVEECGHLPALERAGETAEAMRRWLMQKQ